MLNHLRSVDFVWLFVAFAALTVSTFLMALRWQITARAFGLSLSYPFALREYYLAQLINAALPGGVTGDVTRAVRARGQANLTAAAQSVVAERLLGQIALFAALAAGFTTTLFWSSAIAWGLWSWVVPLAIATSGAVFLGIARSSNATGRFLQQTIDLAKRPAITLYSLIITAALVFAFYSCTRAVGFVIPSGGWLTVIPLVLCAMLVPLSIGGWGWREGAAAALFPLMSIPSSAGVATGVTYGIVVLLVALPGAIILLFQNMFPLFKQKKDPNTP